jgi:hypothetical protein
MLPGKTITRKFTKEGTLMNYGYARRIAISGMALCALIFAGAPRAANAQDMSTGSVNVTVVDPTGAAVPDATLVLKDLGTNDVHTVKSSGKGTAVIPYLNPATYSLTVTREGFATTQFAKVAVQTNQVTNLTATLKVGASTETVSVSSTTSPILNTTNNTLSTTVDLKQVENLPTLARNVQSLAFLVPGAVDDDFNNLPGGAVNTSANGFSTMTNRNKSAGFDDDGTSTTNRLESTQEMTVETGELDASKGGTAAMDIGFLTKRGTNRYHGELFEDYRSEDMNANSWGNNFRGIPRGLLIINDFGGSVSGPILKDKLFAFLSVANYRQPQQGSVTTEVGTPALLSGIYSYYKYVDGEPTSQIETVNVLQAGASAGCSTCTATINPIIAQDLANIQTAISLPGVVYTQGIDLNHDEITYQNKEATIRRYPAVRLDYNVTKNFRLTGVATESNSYFLNTGAAPYPGPLFSNQTDSTVSRNYQVVAGFDWNLKPNFVNAFRVGYLYTNEGFDSQGVGTPTAAMTEQGQLAFGIGLNSGINYFAALKLGYLYPVTSIKDDTTWSHGKHNIVFGFDGATEVDHYYNGQFVPYIGVNSISTGDPVQNALDASVADGGPDAPGDVEGLYATLNGRLTYYSLGQFVNSKTKQYQPGISFNLHEKLTQAALFIQDSWRATPSLTLNYGLRWDFAGASKDETGFYTNPDIANLWGPTGVGDLFKPGALAGVANPIQRPSSESYAPTYVHPEPTVGFAWNPRGTSDGFIGRFLGDGKTVVRGSFTYKNYTEGAQNFWNFGSNNGYNFNTYFFADPTAPQPGFTPGAGFYNAGSVILGGALPALTSTSPNPFQQVIPESTLAFSGSSIATFNPHIKQPYVESWEFGVQRQLSPNNVLEVRYVGNVSKDGWEAENLNEVNIFENGFLTDFKNAQANLAASGGATFQGPNPTPILDQAFQTSGSSPYSDGGLIQDLNQGQAGAFAETIINNQGYLCSLMGANFTPCAQQGIPGTGNYPINFFQVNPYAGTGGLYEMTNDGFSNYNALQVDFRQNLNHGMQFDANYTFAKSLGDSVQGSTAPGYYGGRGNSAPGFYTLRNKSLNYFPSTFDVRNVFHASGTYDLPFGRGRQFLNHNKIANTVIGGWTIGTIITWQGGEPNLLTGGTSTFNQNDGGITLIGVTPKQLQQQMRARTLPGKPRVSMFDPKYIGPDGRANPAYIKPNYNPGTIGQLVWLHDPADFDTDMSLVKVVPLVEGFNLKLQGVFLNATNHVAWSGLDKGIQDTTFGTTSTISAITHSAPRNVEIRANLQF